MLAFLDTSIVYSSEDSLLRITQLNSLNLDNYYLSLNMYNQSSSIEVKGVLGETIEPQFEWVAHDALREPKNSGSIDISIFNSSLFSNYTYEWKNSLGQIVSTNEDLLEAEPGEYSLKLTYQGPFGTKELMKTFRISEKMSWLVKTNIEELGDNSNNIIKTSEDGWNAVIQSENVLDLSADGFIEFSTLNNSEGSDVIYSLSGNAGTSPSDVNYGIGVIKLKKGTQLDMIYYVIENGAIKKFASGVSSDVLKVQYKSATNQITYLQNNQLIYTATSNPSTALHLNGIIFKGGDVIGLPAKDLTPLPYYYTYALLRTKLDADYFLTKDGILNLKCEEEYTSNNNKLNYKIYDNYNHEIVNSSTQPVQTVIYKSNYFTFDLRACGLVQNRYYILEVSNKKSEKKYLRFKY
jgi:hypothetical protein